MRKNIKSICALAMAVTVLSTSFSVSAAESVESYETIQDLLQDADNITSEDIQKLEDASEISYRSSRGRSSFAMFFSDEEATQTETLVAGMHTYTTSTAMANFAGLGYTNDNQGPISIVEATLNYDTPVYIVGLQGTAFVKNQATGIVSDLLAGFSISNPYTKATINAIRNNIPANSNIILTGHSLGGMVAQQVAADSNIKKNYNVLNTVTFGSPVINLFREGDVKRLGDKNDIIPYLSASGIILPVRAIGGLNREDGGYGNVTNFWSAHMGSYCRTDVWGAYDVLGYKNGNATITFDVSTVHFYKAPTKW